MKVYGYQDASKFYDRVKDYLLFQEARHSFLLRICNGLINSSNEYDSDRYLANSRGKTVISSQLLSEHHLESCYCQK